MHMSKALLRSIMEMSRKKTADLIAAIEKRPDAKAILACRPGPGRAHLAWQLMHLGATDDRHLYVRMKGGDAKDPELVRRYAGGSTPDDTIPNLDEIRRYLTARRQEMIDHLRTLDD